MTKTYTLTRVGADREMVLPPFKTRRAALQMAGHSIVDNGHGTKAEAQRWAATVKDGEPSTFGPYTFTLVKSIVDLSQPAKITKERLEG